MKHPYIYGALAGILVVGVYVFFADKNHDTFPPNQISGGYNLQEIQK